MIKLKDLIIESIDSDEVAGVVYIVNKESFLCLKRSDKEQEWSIPKGHIHVDEEPIDGAIRELAERVLDSKGILEKVTRLGWKDLNK